MKKTFHLILVCLAAALGSLNACKMLDADPVSEIPDSQMWQNQRDVNAGIAEIYASFRTALRTNWFCWGEMRSDNFVLYQELPNEYGKLILNQMRIRIPKIKNLWHRHRLKQQGIEEQQI